MANYAQINPGKYHLGYRFATSVMIEKLPMHAENKHRVELKYKHAVVVNRTSYVGNVQVFNRRNGSIKVEGDSMYKSVVNEFDTFADYNKIEAAVNDGEEITALAEFADKVLQFKQNTLYIINVSRQIEILESTHKHKGASNPAAVCKTDYGIAWANENGCFLYDGKRVIDLLEDKGMQKIKQSDWTDFITSASVSALSPGLPMVGYNPRKRHLIVVENTGASGTGLGYIHDMVTGSWVKAGTQRFNDAVKSNFINDWEGNLMYATSYQPHKWVDASSATAQFELQTKDIDFGQPSVRKKVYKVYITYRTGSTTNIQVKYAVDGDTTFDKVFADGTNFTSNVLDNAGSGDWTQAILKPNTSSEANSIYSFALKLSATGTGAEVTRVKCVADSSDSLDGKYFDIYGAGGKTEVWIDVDGGTSAPSGSGSYAQTIEVTEIETDNSAEAVAIAVAEAVGDHANFTTKVEGDTVIITDAASASRTDASDGDTGFTITIDRQGGTSSVPATFQINDISIVYRTKSIK